MPKTDQLRQSEDGAFFPWGPLTGVFCARKSQASILGQIFQGLSLELASVLLGPDITSGHPIWRRNNTEKADRANGLFSQAGPAMTAELWIWQKQALRKGSARTCAAPITATSPNVKGQGTSSKLKSFPSRGRCSWLLILRGSMRYWAAASRMHGTPPKGPRLFSNL